MNQFCSLVAQAADAKTAGEVTRALLMHYAKWKVRRRSDLATRAYLADVAFQLGLLKLCKDAGWIIDRGMHQYAESFGPRLQERLEPKSLVEDRLSGLTDPFKTAVCADSGIGNGSAAYEMCRPGWTIIGTGDEILFSIEGTLRNCLRAHVQGGADGRTPSYASGLFAEAEPLLDLASVIAFVRGDDAHPVLNELFQAWAEVPSPVPASRLEWIIRRAGEIAHEVDESLVRGMFLGVLIDEIDGRCRYPNGMNFGFDRMKSWLDAARRSIHAARRHTGDWTEHKLTAALDDLKVLLRQRAQPWREVGAIDPEQGLRFYEMANQLRAIGFASMGHIKEHHRQCLLSLANDIWRWCFFEEDRVRWANTTPTVTEDRVLRLLNRPWGLLHGDEADLLLRDALGPEGERLQPLGLHLLIHFFRSGIEEGLDGGWIDGAPPSSCLERLKRFVGRRILLSEQRRAVTHVILDAEEARAANQQAQTLIQLFAAWASERPETLDKIGDEPSHLMHSFLDATWTHEVKSIMTRRQRETLSAFQGAPEEVAARLFDFARLAEMPFACLDAYVPEDYAYRPRS